MEKVYKEAFYEVYSILNLLPKNLYNKIPEAFKDFVKDNKSNNYSKKIEEPIEKQDLKDETIVILGIIYRVWLKNKI